MIAICAVWLWRRLPHAHVCTLSPTCPEFALSHGIFSAARRSAYLCGECKSNRPNWKNSH
jgi:hypothetical protein